MKQKQTDTEKTIYYDFIKYPFCSLLYKVIIEKSRVEVSLMGQDTIENVS